MSDEKPKKKRLGCLKIFLFFILAMVCLVMVWLACNYRPIAGPGQPMVVVSEETTRITEPLDANGDVNYLEAVNLRYSEGVTNENNAFVKLLEALGPLPPPTAPEINEAITLRLGMNSLPEDGQYLQEFGSWLREGIERINAENIARYCEEHDVEPYESPELNDDFPKRLVVAKNAEMQFEFASSHPWSAEELPDIEKWRQASEPALNIAREGIGRSHYYYPLVSDRSPKMLHANLGYPQQYSKVADALAVNAMSLLYQDDLEGCIDEIRTIYLFAAKVSQGQSLVEKLVSLSMRHKGLDCTASLCASEKCTPDQLKQLLRDVEGSEVVGDTGDRIDQFERYAGLDAAVSMAREGSSKDYPVGEVEAQLGVYSGIVDLEETLKQLNAYYDRFAEVGKIEDRAEFEAAWTALEDEMVENEKWIMNSAVKTALLGRKSKGIWLGRVLSGVFMPHVKGVVDAENEINARHAMLKVVIAAAIFKQETGAYPAAIDELAPKYLNPVPTDPLTDEAYVWSPEENRIRIHSKLWNNDNQIGVSRNDRSVISAEKVSWEEFSKAQEVDEEEQTEFYDDSFEYSE